MTAGMNVRVCLALGVFQLAVWSLWARIVHHPNRYKLWISVWCILLAMLLEVLDFPPWFGVIDAHAVWHGVTPPLIYLWWSFIRDDARWRVKLAADKAADAGADGKKVQ